METIKSESVYPPGPRFPFWNHGAGFLFVRCPPFRFSVVSEKRRRTRFSLGTSSFSRTQALRLKRNCSSSQVFATCSLINLQKPHPFKNRRTKTTACVFFFFFRGWVVRTRSGVSWQWNFCFVEFRSGVSWPVSIRNPHLRKKKHTHQKSFRGCFQQCVAFFYLS